MLRNLPLLLSYCGLPATTHNQRMQCHHFSLTMKLMKHLRVHTNEYNKKTYNTLSELMLWFTVVTEITVTKNIYGRGGC